MTGCGPFDGKDIMRAFPITGKEHRDGQKDQVEMHGVRVRIRSRGGRSRERREAGAPVLGSPGRLDLPPVRRGEGRVRRDQIAAGRIVIMEPVSLAPNVHWVGAKDPGLTVFDIVIPTEFGTTYNAYLIRGTDKTALIDCVKKPFAEELFRNVSRFLPPERLDYVVTNHSDPDHSGAHAHALR